MCGICGLVAGEGERAPDLEAVARMSGRLVHRGPDDDGLFHEGPVALAARRLSIIDLDHGHQPIGSDVRQRLPQRAVDQRHDGGVRADAE